MGANTANYQEAGGEKWVVSGELQITPTGTLTVDTGATVNGLSTGSGSGVIQAITATYLPTRDGGGIGTSRTILTVPANSIVTGIYARAITSLTKAGGDDPPSLKTSLLGDGDIQGFTAYNQQPWNSALGGAYLFPTTAGATLVATATPLTVAIDEVSTFGVVGGEVQFIVLYMDYTAI